MKQLLIGMAALLFWLALADARGAQSEDNPCLACHAPLTQKKHVHPAVAMGCTSCHTDLDTSAIPHKVKGKIPKGLSAEPPELCLGCHDKQMFEGKVVHVPAAAGMCLACHNPHASDNQSLLVKEPAALCLECHAEIKTRGHRGYVPSQHPLGYEATKRADPLRPDKQFSCVSCHEPHRSELPRLTRFGTGMTSCQKCHKM